MRRLEELVEHGRQEAVDLAGGVAREADEAAERRVELYAVAKRLEEDLVAAKAENAALKQEMRALVEEERAADASGKTAVRRRSPAVGSAGRRGRAGSRMANENTQTKLPAASHPGQVVPSRGVRAVQRERAGGRSRRPPPPSSASPGTALGLRGRAPPRQSNRCPQDAPLAERFHRDGGVRAARRRTVRAGVDPPGWAMDTASAARRRRQGRGPVVVRQFGPRRPRGRFQATRQGDGVQREDPKRREEVDAEAAQGGHRRRVRAILKRREANPAQTGEGNVAPAPVPTSTTSSASNPSSTTGRTRSSPRRISSRTTIATSPRSAARCATWWMKYLQAG